MGEVLVKEKEIVIPGQVLVKGMDAFPGSGSYRDKEEIYSSRLGIVYLDGRAIKVVPVSGVYMPKIGDMVIGRVFDITMNGWRIELNCTYPSMMSLKDATSDYIQKGADLTQYYNIGDYVVCKITNVTSQKLVDVSMREPGLKKLSGGRIFKVSPSKVPRIIGKKGSMISMIKLSTGCRIVVGQNGLAWISGDLENEFIALQAIKKIEDQSHCSGLTNSIKEFLEEKTGKKIEGVEQNEL
ncbi:RNA-binding protein [Candidatus Woesearchaeota archaeon]|nr:RNA-binding protein [Candidatus Woesearchaeota archaeon]